MFEVMIKTEFASAHNLRDYKGACEAMHGHNWKIDILVEAKELDATGLAVDFNVLKENARLVTLHLTDADKLSVADNNKVIKISGGVDRTNMFGRCVNLRKV